MPALQTLSVDGGDSALNGAKRLNNLELQEFGIEWTIILRMGEETSLTMRMSTETTPVIERPIMDVRWQ